MKLIIDIPENIRVAISRMGLLRIPDEMIRVVDKAIQSGIPLDKIRVELHANAEMYDDGDYYLRDEWVNYIFDKYKGFDN